MATEKKLQPIIVKRVKKAGHAAHGGAWKIAYADFMTAMMAFFLLMWLLGSTAKGDLQGIAAYFNSPLKVSMAGGDGSGNSSSIITGGGTDLAKIHGQVRRSDAEQDNDRRKADASVKAIRAQQDAQRIKSLRARIDAMISSNSTLNEYKAQIRIDVTPDGLQIQIVDEQNRPMFDSGSAILKPYMREILREVGSAMGGVENRISLAGHTDAAPYGNGQRGYSNWELSSDRANASRRELVSAGMPDDKLARVVGLGASDLLYADKPRAPQNRRITITVLTREAESRLLGWRKPSAPADAATAPATEAAPDAASPNASSSSGTQPMPAKTSLAPSTSSSAVSLPSPYVTARSSQADHIPWQKTPLENAGDRRSLQPLHLRASALPQEWQKTTTIPV
jgi:chemotaxis protein MotB